MELRTGGRTGFAARGHARRIPKPDARAIDYERELAGVLIECDIRWRPSPALANFGTLAMAEPPRKRMVRLPGGGDGRAPAQRLKTAKLRTPSSQAWLERQLHDPFVAE